MKNKRNIQILVFVMLCLTYGVFVSAKKIEKKDSDFVTYMVDPKKKDIRFYWKDDKHELFRSLQQVNVWLEKRNKKLEFAMNGGMYKADNSPLGLYIENQKILSPINRKTGKGNFYIAPNGIFYITTDNVPNICMTKNFDSRNTIKYATQSGPMLLIDGQIHSAFKKGSANVNIRNGVGILPNHQVVFVMSKKEVNFFTFAHYFKSLGCSQALYLDGFISRTYLPKEKWVQTDGNFGVIIGVTSNE